MTRSAANLWPCDASRLGHPRSPKGTAVLAGTAAILSAVFFGPPPIWGLLLVDTATAIAHRRVRPQDHQVHLLTGA